MSEPQGRSTAGSAESRQIDRRTPSKGQHEARRARAQRASAAEWREGYTPVTDHMAAHWVSRSHRTDGQGVNEAIGGLEVEDPPHASNSWIEVDPRALRNNVAELRRVFQAIADEADCEPPEICAVTKGNAYGHGWHHTVPALERAGIGRIAVFAAHEAMHASEFMSAGTALEIMGYAHPVEVPWVVRHGCEPWIGTEVAWPRYREEAERQGRHIRVHIELESGMNRTGLDREMALTTAREIADHEGASLAGVCSHLAGAEASENDARVTLQEQRFQEFLDLLGEHGIGYERAHLASSSAALLRPTSWHDQVRTGISIYGYWPTREVHQRFIDEFPHVRPPALLRAISWRSRIMSVRTVAAGSLIGYGRSFQMKEDGRIAIVPVGYADGFARGLSNFGHVLVHGERAPIIGHVNMNMIQVDVSAIPDVVADDEVVLIGEQGDRAIGISSFAEANDMVNYELMTRLSEDIPREPCPEERKVEAPNLERAEARAARVPGADGGATVH